MIGRLSGVLLEKNPPELLIDTGGVGYELEAPMSTFYNLPAVGQEVVLQVHMVVRDDAHLLFGFLTKAERAHFRTLIKVSGVGAKVALGILSGMSVSDFSVCVQRRDVTALTRIPGIGKKTAERLVLELQDKLPDTLAPSQASTDTLVDVGDSLPTDARSQAIDALIALQYKPVDATRLVDSTGLQDASVEEIIRAALKSIHKT